MILDVPRDNSGAPLGAPAERHSEHAISGSYQLWIEVCACASSLGSAFGVPWGAMEYVQNAVFALYDNT